MFNLKTVLPAVLLVVFTASPAFSQVTGLIDSVEGDVVVQRAGDMYRTQNLGAILDGDVVSSLEASSARISLSNGCTLDLEANKAVVVSTTASDCENAFVASEQTAFVSQGLQGAPILPLLAAVGAIATIVVIAEDDKPASP